ncbi:hypothetical protein DL768_009642 [Monosporascus sp. mg162]|nr:hypothetical protein DL768_009642 [Monosporascus sp. mg162]
MHPLNHSPANTVNGLRCAGQGPPHRARARGHPRSASSSLSTWQLVAPRGVPGGGPARGLPRGLTLLPEPAGSRTRDPIAAGWWEAAESKRATSAKYHPDGVPAFARIPVQDLRPQSS